MPQRCWRFEGLTLNFLKKSAKSARWSKERTTIIELKQVVFRYLSDCDNCILKPLRQSNQKKSHKKQSSWLKSRSSSIADRGEFQRLKRLLNRCRLFCDTEAKNRLFRSFEAPSNSFPKWWSWPTLIRCQTNIRPESFAWSYVLLKCCRWRTVLQRTIPSSKPSNKPSSFAESLFFATDLQNMTVLKSFASKYDYYVKPSFFWINYWKMLKFM